MVTQSGIEPIACGSSVLYVQLFQTRRVLSLVECKGREGRQFTVNEAAHMLIDQETVSIPTRFRRSPDAHAGIRNRYAAEKKAFK